MNQKLLIKRSYLYELDLVLSIFKLVVVITDKLLI